MVIDESRCKSDLTTSEDNEFSDWQKDDMNLASKMASSTNPVDKRFLQMYMLSKACDSNTRFGYQNDLLLTSTRMQGNSRPTSTQVKTFV